MTLAFYLCPTVKIESPRPATVGRVFIHRAALERYTWHRGLGEMSICSIEDPSIATQAAIAADQSCIEWPDLDAQWDEVGRTRRALIVEALAAHGVPVAWIGPTTTAREVLRVALKLGLLRQRGQLPAIAERALSPVADQGLYDAIAAQRIPITIGGRRI